MVHHAVTGRLLEAARGASKNDKSRYSHITTLRDVANAFPPFSHESMDENLKDTTNDYTRMQLRARHERLNFRIQDGEGYGMILAPGTGGAQGDKVMPTQFRRVYEGSLEEWIEHKERDLGRGIRSLDHMTGEEVQVDLTCFADDAKDLSRM